MMGFTFTLIQNSESHKNEKRDTSREIDPYAAYSEYYANEQATESELPDAIASNEINEKQGFTTTVQDVFGPDAGVRQILVLCYDTIQPLIYILHVES